MALFLHGMILTRLTLNIMLGNQFRIKDLGLLKDLDICQRKYALEILDDSGILPCKPASTRMVLNLKLSATGSPA